MTSQPGLQTIVVHILSNITQSKGNQTMKFGQLIEYNKINIFLQKLCAKWSQETISSYFLNMLGIKWNQESIDKTWDYSSRHMLNFKYSEKGLGLVSPPHFVYDFFY